MIKRLFVFGIASILLISLAGCGGDETDEQELMDAQNLLQGLTMLGVMTNSSNTGGYRAPFGPPLFWQGPDVFNLPEGDDSIYYSFVFKFPLDSIDITIDSLMWLFIFTPDIWDSLYEDSLAIGFDTWLIGDNRDDIYFHTGVDIPDTAHITGTMKWNWTDTWWQYVFDNSTIDEAAEISITTSQNIRLSAHFLFDEDGAGSLEDNWGKFQNTTFVKYEFFAEPDENGYDGYYQLLSEAWKIDHYFVLTDPGT
jgi:hypothetical protein